ncbi:hypothetical protein [Spirosoma aerophilum]
MLTAKGKNIEFTLPSAWFEVNIKQFVDLYPKRKTNEDGTIYLDPYETAKAFVSDLAAYHAAPAGDIDRMLNEWLPVLGPMPNWPALEVPFEVAGVRPPADIGLCTQLQVESARMIVNDAIEEEGEADYILLAVPMLAIFLYPLITGKPLTDTDAIAEVIPVVEALPVTEALPLSAFFLSSLASPKASGLMSFDIRYPSGPPKTLRMRWFRNWQHIRKRLSLRG